MGPLNPQTASSPLDIPPVIIKEFLELMLRRAVRLSYQSGDIVVGHGKKQNELYFIESGEVDVVVNNKIASTLSGKLVAGCCFGDMGLLSQSWVAPADFVCIDASIIYCLDRKTIDEVISSNDRDTIVFYRYLAHACGRRVEAINKELDRFHLLLIT
jgi:signal-transduction protein with cAMP-binding, CBS, and nucleotidyltransferase domain